MITENKAIIPSELTVDTVDVTGSMYYASDNLLNAVFKKIPIAFNFKVTSTTIAHVYIFGYLQTTGTTITGIGLQIITASDRPSINSCGIRSFSFNTSNNLVLPGQTTSLL